MAPSQILLVTPDVTPEGSLQVVVLLGKVLEALGVPQGQPLVGKAQDVRKAGWKGAGRRLGKSWVATAGSP